MRRVSLAVVGLVVLVVGACGAEDGAGGSGRPALPWAAGGGGGAEVASGAASTGMVAEDGANRDMSLPYRPVTYELADGVSVDVESSAAYRVDTGTIDARDVERLARALGIDGSVDEVDGGQAWSVTEGDRALWVFHLDGSWNLSGGQRSDATATATAACSSDGECKEIEVREPRRGPLPDLPSKEEAKRIAERFAEDAELGDVEVAGDVGGDETYGWTVSLTRTLDGVRSHGLQTFLTIGSGGTIVGGGGSLGAPSKVGDYPLVSPAEAFERFNAGGVGVGVARPAVGGAEPAVDLPADSGATEPGSASDPGTTPSDPDSSGSELVDPATPTDPPPPPPAGEIRPVPETLPPEVVELDEARLVLLPSYGMCPGDVYYLVPAYEFTKGSEHVVGPAPAIEDDDLANAPGGDSSVSSGDEPCPTPDGREPDVPTTDMGGGSSGYSPPDTSR